MNTALPSRLPLEMLHRVGDVAVRARNPGLAQGVIKQLSSRPHKRPSLPIFQISWLFTDQNDLCRSLTLSEDCLGSVLPQWTSATSARRRAHDCEVIRRWDLRAFLHFKW
jgi:hypothetical protein